MEIHINLKLTQYPIGLNIYAIRFLVKSCLKYAQQYQNRTFEKTCWINLPLILCTIEV